MSRFDMIFSHYMIDENQHDVYVYHIIDKYATLVATDCVIIDKLIYIIEEFQYDPFCINHAKMVIRRYNDDYDLYNDLIKDYLSGP